MQITAMYVLHNCFNPHSGEPNEGIDFSRLHMINRSSEYHSISQSESARVCVAAPPAATAPAGPERITNWCCSWVSEVFGGFLFISPSSRLWTADRCLLPILHAPRNVRLQTATKRIFNKGCRWVKLDECYLPPITWMPTCSICYPLPLYVEYLTGFAIPVSKVLCNGYISIAEGVLIG